MSGDSARCGEERLEVGRTVTVAGRAVHVLERGSGPAVVLLHGSGGMGQEILGPFARRAGVRWIAPDRPGFGLSPPLGAGGGDPRALADWTAKFLDAMALDRVRLVAHSLAAGTALWLAARHPERVERLVLVAPFCRPTPHRPMVGLRLATAPVIGPPLRRWLVPALMPRLKRGILRSFTAPDPVPPWLSRLPIRVAARPQALVEAAAELRAFNEAMAALERLPPLAVEVRALFAGADGTAEARWHEPWLRRRVAGLHAVRVPDAGHALHHVRPRLVARLAAAGLPAQPVARPRRAGSAAHLI